MAAILAGRLCACAGIEWECECGRPSSASTSEPRAPGPACSTRPGHLLATARHPIAVWHEAGDIVEQSSADIWAACAASVRAAMAEAALPPDAVKGIGFDATCSLVVLDAAGEPLTVSTSGDQRRNVIVWMDHRADRRGAADQRHPGRRAALCRRLDLARDGNSEAALAEAASALELRRGRSFLRPRRLSVVSRHRIDGALDVHGHLQMEFPGA